MHHCLFIQEIVHNIAQHADRRSLLPMSLSCHALYEPAMDVIWKSLPGLSPLIKCLPEYSWTTGYGKAPVIAMTAAELLAHDWHRLKHHARRVRELRIPHASYDQNPFRVAESCWEILQATFCNEQMLPNLRALRICEDDNIKYTRLFLQPSLLKIEFIDASSAHHAMITALQAVGSLVPSLQTIRMGHERTYETFNSTPLTDSLSAAICSSSHLSQVTTSVCHINVKAVSHLSSLPSLTVLECDLHRRNFPPASSLGTPTGPAFQSLTILTLSTPIPDIAHLLSLLTASRPSRLRRFDLSLTYQSGQSDSEPPAPLPTSHSLYCLFSIIGTFTSLEVIEVDVPLPGSEDLNPEFIVNKDTLMPLITLKNLRSLDMTTIPMDLHSAPMDLFAKAWPRIEALHLGFGSPIAEDQWGVAAEDLLPFAIHCRRLQTLGVHITSSRRVHPADISQLLPTPQRVLDTVLISDSYIAEEDVGYIAVFFAFAFPNAYLECSHMNEEMTERMDRLSEIQEMTAKLLHKSEEDDGGRESESESELELDLAYYSS